MGLQQGYRLVPLIALLSLEAPSGASFVSGVLYVDPVRHFLLGGTMRLGNYLRVFSALSVLLLWHSPASAVDYYWTPASGSEANKQFTSPADACDAFALSIKNSSGTSVYTHGQVVGTSDTSRNCRGVRSNGQWLLIGNVIRYGDSCPANTQYDQVAGKCSAPENPCAEKAGVEDSFSKSGIAPDGFGFITSNGYFGSDYRGCKGGCATEIIDKRCKARVSGAYFCRGTAIYTGQQCATTGTGDQIDEDTNESTDPQTITEDKPCVYSSSGDKQVCESSKSEEKEGRSCGTFNGVETCVSTQPTKNGIDIRTEVTTETNVDGSKTITKKDTAVSTNCKGVNNCTTKTATTTTTTKKDSSGNTTSTGSACVGNACPSKTTDPDGDGDGMGDCATGVVKCGDGIGGPNGEGGEGQDWYTPGEDTFESVLTQFAAAVKQTPIASQATKFLTFRASGGCPQWSVSVWVFDIDIDQLCSGDIPWDAIRAVILAAAAFLAFRIALF